MQARFWWNQIKILILLRGFFLSALSDLHILYTHIIHLMMRYGRDAKRQGFGTIIRVLSSRTCVVEVVLASLSSLHCTCVFIIEISPRTQNKHIYFIVKKQIVKNTHSWRWVLQMSQAVDPRPWLGSKRRNGIWRRHLHDAVSSRALTLSGDPWSHLWWWALATERHCLHGTNYIFGDEKRI